MNEDIWEHHEGESPDLFSLKRQYRQMMAKILVKVRAYRGSEVQYKDVMQDLVDLEHWKIQHFGKGSQLRLSDEEERQIANFFNYGHPDRAIGDLLSMLSKRLEKVMHGDEPLSTELAKMGIVEIHLPGILLPPGSMPSRKSPEKETGREKHSEPRFDKLIAFLNRRGIYTDDLVVCDGELPHDIQRHETYRLVEVPRLNRQILICDAIGEATYVVQGMFPRALLMKLSKVQLIERFGGKVIRIEKHNEVQWEKELNDAIFSSKIGTKVDVKSIEAIRGEIMALYPTPRDWLAAVRRTKRTDENGFSLKIFGMGTSKVARKFGMASRPSTIEGYCEWGKKIYGEDPLFEMKKYTSEELIDEIKREYPTPADWIKLGQGGFNQLKFFGMGSQVVSKMLGLDSRPRSKMEFYVLGRAIYGNDPVFEIMEYTNEELIAEVKKLYPTAADWVAVRGGKRQHLMVSGVGVRSLAKKFGVEGNPQNRQDVYYELGRRIYGDDPLFEVKNYTAEELVAEVKRLYPTPADWIKLGMTGFNKLRFFGIGSQMVSKILGFDSRPKRTVDFYALGRRIYGEDLRLT